MRLASTILTAALGLTTPGFEGAAQARQIIWFYATAEHQQWCAVTKEGTAKVAAASQQFASGLFALLRYHNNTLDNATITTESEDAYVEDTYTFGPSMQVTAVVRHGHYINDPYFSVAFVPNKSGTLVLNAASILRRKRQENGGHETYFVDWPIYRSFREFPFARLVAMGARITAVHHCSVNL